MNLFTSVNFSDQVQPIGHSTKILAMGSCFAEHIGGRLIQHHFDINLNPFGINYHPMVIHRAIVRLIENRPYELHELEKHNGLWHSWDHHGKFSDPDQKRALEKINDSFIAAQQQLENLDHLMITFGTAYGHTLKKHGAIVANCHKYPADYFIKSLSEPNDLVTAWTELIYLLKSHYKALKITFTVSPVRHKKEGLVENNRSKARCLYLVEKLTEEFTDCNYFPAYEIVIDELRDYRFFKSDLVHPSDQAIEYIWEKYADLFFSEETKVINKKLNDFTLASTHRPFFPESKEHQEFLNKTLEKLIEFKNQYPLIDVKSLRSSLCQGLI